MKLLDLFCGEGGASAGYAAAGFDVTGVDAAAMPRYPFTFVQGDALTYVAEHGHEYDVITASPPCQAYSPAGRISGKRYPDLVAATRAALAATGKPYIIENVETAPLIGAVLLCGTMFGLRTYRHRLFESNVPLVVPSHPAHRALSQVMGRPAAPGEFFVAVGNFPGVAAVRENFRVPWMSQKGIAQCVPPAYTEYLGRQLF